MASELFNSLTGYSIGIPPVQVIDSNGNVVSNFLNLSGNVSANKIYSNNYYYSNGQPFGAPGGNNTQLQFNNNGILGGIPNATYSNGVLNLGSLTGLSISGGNNGYFLQTDGAGNLTWAAGGGGGGNGSPGGANTQVQFNDAGTFGGDSGFTYNKVTNTLYVENISAGDTLGDSVNIVGNLAVTGNIGLSTDMSIGGQLSVTGNVTGDYILGNGYYLTDVHVDTANYVIQPDQSNITSLGNLLYLNVDGDINGLGNIAITDNYSGNNLSLSSNISAANATITNKVIVGSNLTVNSAATLRLAGNLNATGSPNLTLGTLSNIHISGGTVGQVLSTDGAGNLYWAFGGGGNGSPGGSNGQIQYNNDGYFGGDAYLTYDDTSHTVQIGGRLIANSVQIGSGSFKWSTEFVYFATTTTNTPGQLLYSIPVSEVSGVEFHIIATDPSGPSRQSCKISSVYYEGVVQYNEYASLFVNGGVGNFDVVYNPGDIITPPSLDLLVTPSASAHITYKMLIIQFAP